MRSAQVVTVTGPTLGKPDSEVRGSGIPTTPFEVGSTRWFGFRRREEKIGRVDAKIFFHLRNSMNLFDLEGVGVVVWWKWS